MKFIFRLLIVVLIAVPWYVGFIGATPFIFASEFIRNTPRYDFAIEWVKNRANLWRCLFG